MAIEWALSADKHQVPHGDAVFAIMNNIFISDKVDTSHARNALPRKLFVGPAHEQTDRLLEVLVEVRSGGTLWIYHVMDLGPKYRQLMEDNR